MPERVTGGVTAPAIRAAIPKARFWRIGADKTPATGCCTAPDIPSAIGAGTADSTEPDRRTSIDGARTRGRAEGSSGYKPVRE